MKNKKILGSIVVATLLSTNLIANDELTMDQLKVELDNVKQELQLMKEVSSQSEELNNVLLDSISQTNEDVLDLDERIEDVETLSLIDKVKFGVEFRTRNDNYFAEAGDGEKAEDTNVWSNRLRLNMHSKITDDLSFYGRLSIYKNWSEGYINSYDGMADYMDGRKPESSSMYVERAYIDWKIVEAGSVPITLTIGRQPSGDGPSYQFRENGKRKSTYSALSFDGASDGIVATFDLAQTTKLPDAKLRIAYGKAVQDNYYENLLTTQDMFDPAQENGDTNLIGIFFDTGLNLGNESLLQLSWVHADNVGYAGVELGNIDLFTGLIEYPKVGGTNLDLFASVGVSVSKPTGNTVDMSGFGMGHWGMLDTSATADTATTESQVGHAFWFGGRYKFDAPSLNNPRIGLEFNYGSENWFSFTQGSNDLTNKLATRGSGVEAYYTQPINRYAYLRVGVQMLDYDYTGSNNYMGAPTKVDGMPQTLSELTNINFLFNVKF